MQEDREICLLLKEMFTKLKRQRRRGKGVKPLGGMGDVWGAKIESRKAENSVCPSSACHCANHTLNPSLTKGICLFYYTN